MQTLRWQVTTLIILSACSAARDPSEAVTQRDDADREQTTEAALPISPVGVRADADEAFRRTPRLGAPTEAEAAERRDVLIEATDPRLAWLGRVDLRDAENPRLGWTGAGLRLWLEASALELWVQPQPAGATDYYSVRIDERDPVVLEIAAGVERVVVAEALSPGLHQVEMRKRTEPLLGAVTIQGVVAREAGALVSAATKARHILAIGDSITAGYGNEGQGPACGFSAETENGLQTYVAFVADAFEAEWTTIAISGKGIFRNRDPLDPETMPVMYQRMSAYDPLSSMEFDESMDLILVHLGTNDFAGSNPDPEAFAAAYHDFLDTLQADFPGASILLLSGPMLSDHYPPGLQQRTTLNDHLAQIIAERRAGGDDKVSWVDLGVQGLPGELWGCDWHPHVTVHQRMASTLLEPVERSTGWSVIESLGL